MGSQDSDISQIELKQQRYLASLKKVDLRAKAWPRLHYAMVHHINVRGGRMTFDDKPYLLDIYKDTATEIVMQSSVQTGKSEFLIIASFAWAEQGLQVMYVIPTTELRNQFVANRIDKTIETVPHYKRQMVSATNVAASRGLKHFGKGSIFYAGSNSQTTFIEKPLDLVIADELDRFDLANYEKADDRLTASPYKLKYEASNPTVEKFGINKRYRRSDMRELFIKCPHCQKWQRMNWFRNVVRQIDEGRYELLDSDWSRGDNRDIRMFCIGCWKPINRYTKQCSWVPRYPEIKDTHGYKIHQMMSAYVKLSTMWEKFENALNDETATQVFFNSMLGETFAAEGAKLTDAVLNACIEPYMMPHNSDNLCVMGVDVGKRLNVVVREILPGEKLRLVYVGAPKDFSDLDYLFARYNIVGYVIDSMPETRKSREWSRKKPGRGWICRYQDKLTEITESEDNEGKVVSADRTMIMDRVQKFYLNRNYVNPANAASLCGGEYYEQIKNPTRVYDPERERYDWIGEEDHYYHAEVYCLLAYVCRGEFRVTGIPLNASAEPMVEQFSDLPLPPNASPALIEYYKRLFAQKTGEFDNG